MPVYFVLIHSLILSVFISKACNRFHLKLFLFRRELSKTPNYLPYLSAASRMPCVMLSVMSKPKEEYYYIIQSTLKKHLRGMCTLLSLVVVTQVTDTRTDAERCR